MTTQGRDMSTYKQDMTEVFEPLSADEQQELFRRWKQGDQAARDALVASVLPLIFRTCSAVQKNFPEIDLDDAVSIANLEFLESLDAYDPKESGIGTFANFIAWAAVTREGRKEQRRSRKFVSLDEINNVESEPEPDDDIDPLGPDDLDLLRDILGGSERKAPRGVMGVCRRHNLTWRQLFAYMDQIDNRLQEGATAHSLLSA